MTTKIMKKWRKNGSIWLQKTDISAPFQKTPLKQEYYPSKKRQIQK
jgi:hypothetical protein